MSEGYVLGCSIDTCISFVTAKDPVFKDLKVLGREDVGPELTFECSTFDPSEAIVFPTLSLAREARDHLDAVGLVGTVVIEMEIARTYYRVWQAVMEVEDGDPETEVLADVS